MKRISFYDQYGSEQFHFLTNNDHWTAEEFNNAFRRWALQHLAAGNTVAQPPAYCAATTLTELPTKNLPPFQTSPS